MSTKRAALLFGINYVRTPDARLRGCVNDVTATADFLRRRLGFGDVTVLTDDARPMDTSLAGMIRNMFAIATRSWRDNLEVVWLHYSGHGTQIMDRNGDESDGLDEALCPSDFMTAGLLSDDIIRQLLAMFNPATRVVFVVDACNSGTMGDLRWTWDADSRRCVPCSSSPAVSAKVLMISGCLDTQTSADAWDAKDRRFEGALTNALLDVADTDNFASTLSDAAAFVSNVRALLQQRGFSQVPRLTASFDLTDPASRHLVPQLPATTSSIIRQSIRMGGRRILIGPACIRI